MEGDIESFVGNVGMGDCCNGVVEGCEVVLWFVLKGGLHFLGMVDLLQGVCPLDWEFGWSCPSLCVTPVGLLVSHLGLPPIGLLAGVLGLSPI